MNVLIFWKLYPTTQTQVNNTICSLNTTRCNLVPIPTTVLKKYSPGIIAAITAIINSSLQNALVLVELKKPLFLLYSKIKIRILTPSATTDPYLTSFLLKIFEKIVPGQLLEHLTLHSLLDKFQSAYKPGFSTETALIKITNDILT